MYAKKKNISACIVTFRNIWDCFLLQEVLMQDKRQTSERGTYTEHFAATCNKAPWNTRALHMDCTLTNLQELCLVLQKYSHLLISGRVWTRETSRKSMPCDVSCWTKNEKRPMWDSWVLKIHNCSVPEPALLSSMLYLAATAVISVALSCVSQQDSFYQVAANVVLAAGWPGSISSSREWLCRLLTSTEQHQRTA